MNAILTGLPDVSNISWVNIVGYFIFGGIGFVAFVYGKKQKSLTPLLIGLTLMMSPYFLTNALWLYIVGTGLCFLLYFWRD